MPFDANNFMQQTVDAPMDTTIQQCPEGEFTAMIDDIDPEKAFRSGTSEKSGKDWASFVPKFVIQDPAVAAALGREKVTVDHKGIFLDVGPDGGLDTGKGKNVDLGRLREAVGQNNDAGWTFGKLSGAGPVIVKVVHEPDRKDPEKKYAKVTRVAKIA